MSMEENDLLELLKIDTMDGEKIPLNVAKTYLTANPKLPDDPTRLQVLNFNRCMMVVTDKGGTSDVKENPDYYGSVDKQTVKNFLDNLRGNAGTLNHVDGEVVKQIYVDGEPKKSFITQRFVNNMKVVTNAAADHGKDVINYLIDSEDHPDVDEHTVFHGLEVAQKSIKKTLLSGDVVDKNKKPLSKDERRNYLNQKFNAQTTNCPKGLNLIYHDTTSNIGLVNDIPFGKSDRKTSENTRSSALLTFKKNASFHGYPCESYEKDNNVVNSHYESEATSAKITSDLLHEHRHDLPQAIPQTAAQGTSKAHVILAKAKNPTSIYTNTNGHDKTSALEKTEQHKPFTEAHVELSPVEHDYHQHSKEPHLPAQETSKAHAILAKTKNLINAQVNTRDKASAPAKVEQHTHALSREAQGDHSHDGHESHHQPTELHVPTLGASKAHAILAKTKNLTDAQVNTRDKASAPAKVEQHTHALSREAQGDHSHDGHESHHQPTELHVPAQETSKAYLILAKMKRQTNDQHDPGGQDDSDAQGGSKKTDRKVAFQEPVKTQSNSNKATTFSSTNNSMHANASITRAKPPAQNSGLFFSNTNAKSSASHNNAHIALENNGHANHHSENHQKMHNGDTSHIATHNSAAHKESAYSHSQPSSLAHKTSSSANHIGSFFHPEAKPSATHGSDLHQPRHHSEAPHAVSHAHAHPNSVTSHTAFHANTYTPHFSNSHTGGFFHHESRPAGGHGSNSHTPTSHHPANTYAAAHAPAHKDTKSSPTNKGYTPQWTAKAAQDRSAQNMKVQQQAQRAREQQASTLRAQQLAAQRAREQRAREQAAAAAARAQAIQAAKDRASQIARERAIQLARDQAARQRAVTYLYNSRKK